MCDCGGWICAECAKWEERDDMHARGESCGVAGCEECDDDEDQ